MLIGLTMEWKIVQTAQMSSKTTVETTTDSLIHGPLIVMLLLVMRMTTQWLIIKNSSIVSKRILPMMDTGQWMPLM